MSRILTAKERLIAIRWLLDNWLNFSAIEKLKHDHPEIWGSRKNIIIRACYNASLVEEKRLRAILDDALIVELEAEINYQFEIDNIRSNGFAKIDAENQDKDKLLALIKKFIGRKKGSISPQAKHIHELAKNHRTKTAKELLGLADKSIIGVMTYAAFRDHITKARKQFPKERKFCKKPFCGI